MGRVWETGVSHLFRVKRGRSFPIKNLKGGLVFWLFLYYSISQKYNLWWRMSDGFRFSIVVLLLFCVGVLGNSSNVYATEDGKNILQCAEKGANRLYQSNKYSVDGKLVPPFSTDELNTLGRQGLVLRGITYGRTDEGVDIYLYIFTCTQAVAYQMITIYLNTRERLNVYESKGWHFSAFVPLEGKYRYYLHRAMQGEKQPTQ